MTYQVRLEVFEGPFDLLLQLIAKRKLEITEVDLADITSDFLASLGDLADLDLETATRFLVIAATLIELKAARLLPRDDQDELEDLLGETRDLLYARLLEYRAFRQLADVVGARLAEHSVFVGRQVPLDAPWRSLVPDAPLEITADDLARLAGLALRPKPEPVVEFGHIRRNFISIQDAATSVLQRLGDPGGSSVFSRLVTGRSRGDAVVFFLALLELYKLGHLDLEQTDHRDDLTVLRRESMTDLSVLAELDRALDDADETPDRDDAEQVVAAVDGTSETS